jgi:hypothetical protein
MNKRHLQSAAAVALASGAAWLGLRQQRNGWGAYSRYGRLFRPAYLTTVEGTVASIGRFVPLPGMTEGKELVLRTDAGRITVHVGPSKYIAIEEFVELGARISVTGAAAEIDNELVMVAATIHKGDKALALRDDHGRPLWRKRIHVGLRKQPPPTIAAD